MNKRAGTKEKMTEMSENSRKTFIMAINRIYKFTSSSHRLQEASLEILHERSKLLQETYVQFLQHHCAVVSKMPQHKLKEHQDIADAMDDMYLSSMAAMRKRINVLEAEEVARRHTERKREQKSPSPEKVQDLRQALEENRQRLNKLRIDEHELNRYEQMEVAQAPAPRVASVIQRGPRTPSPAPSQRKRDRDMRDNLTYRYRPANFTCHLCCKFHPLHNCIGGAAT